MKSLNFELLKCKFINSPSLKTILFYMLLSFGYFPISSLRAQVTIGSGIEPNKGSLLQLKENDDVSGNENSYKGFNLPRVNLTDGNNLYPMFLKDPKDPASGPSDEYAANKAAIDKAHIGLTVYNVHETAESKVGLYIWKGDHWEYSDGISPWYSVSTHSSATQNDQDIYLSGTVTIGKDITEAEDKEGALLQLEEPLESASALKSTRALPLHNAYKGLAMPRVKLTDKNELYPMFLTKKELPYDATSNPATSGYGDEATRAALKASHVGLVVYNVTDDSEKGLCPGMNQWDGEQWSCLQNKVRNAQFDTVACSDITVHGTYVEGMPVTTDNYLSITLNVVKTGDYAFIISMASGNGYNFYVSGNAPIAGRITVNVPCQGIPVNAQTDKLVFSGMEVAEGCEVEVHVVQSTAVYSLNCSTTSVNGVYEKNVPLTASNTITLNVTVARPGSYTVETPLTNGIRFSARGNFTEGTQSITLTGSGTPTINEDFPITIEANTAQGNTTCNATIPVILPPMTFATLGNADTWSWYSPQRRAALENGYSFGPSGVVQVESLSQLWHVDTAPDQAADYLENGFAVDNIRKYPDVVLCFAYSFTLDERLVLALAQYINKGGCVIYAASSIDVTGSYVNILLNEIFGIQTAQAQVAGTGTVDDNTYPIANNPEDPIINGPFGNLSSRYWGEDNNSTGTIILTSLPPNSVQICSAHNDFGKITVNPDYSVVWYNNSKNFVYFGDCTGSAYPTITDVNSYPSIYTTTGLPKSKLYGNYGINQPNFVYNSALELNAVAWAIKKAAVSGINPH